MKRTKWKKPLHRGKKIIIRNLWEEHFPSSSSAIRSWNLPTSKNFLISAFDNALFEFLEKLKVKANVKNRDIVEQMARDRLSEKCIEINSSNCERKKKKERNERRNVQAASPLFHTIFSRLLFRLSPPRTFYNYTISPSWKSSWYFSIIARSLDTI